MLRKWGTLVLLLLATPLFAWAQTTGKLAGSVTDASTGDPLPGANVFIVGTQLGTATDVNGEYFILGVPVGQYDIQATFIGYGAETVTGVDVSAGYTREINFDLSPGLQLDEIVVEYERPLIQKDAIGVPKVVTAEDIQNLPVRGVASVAALQGGVVSSETSDNLYIRGGRDEEVSYYVDGVRVIGSVAVPTQAIQEQEMLIGSIPARYGDAMSGIISITTKSGAPNFFGSVEAISSEVLDDYGYNNVEATLGGPLFKNRLSFFMAGEFSDRADAGPRAVEFPQISEDLFNFIQLNPQSVQIINDNDPTDIRYLPFPGNVADSLASADVLALLDGSLPEGFHLAAAHPDPIFAPLTFTDDQFSNSNARPNNSSQSFALNGNFAFNPVDPIRIRVGGGYEQLERKDFPWYRAGGIPSYSLYANNRHNNEDRYTWRAFGSWTHYLSNSTFYQLQVDYSDFKGYNYEPGFGNDPADQLFYGDVDHPWNATAARYRKYDEATDTYVRSFSDGNLPNFIDVHSLYAPPGAEGWGGYDKFRTERFGFRANATTQISLHQLEFGGEYEQRTQRLFSSAPWSWARFFDDGNPEGGAELAVSQYDQLRYQQISDNIAYYGYNFLGTEEVDDQDVDRFATGAADCNDCFNLSPYQPIYYAGYISDKLEYKDIVIQAGLRIDVFDNNALIFKDRYAFYPIVRAGEVGNLPPGVGSDYAVYFSESTGNVVGYRDLGGRFYDQNGQRVDPRSVLLDNGGKPQVQRDAEGNELKRLTSDVFTDYEPQVTVQPRIGVSFPITDQALFFASYDVVTQRPSENQFDTIAEFQETAVEAGRDSNPALEPEKTTQYELGFRQRLGARAAFQISGFYRQIQDKISLRIVQNAFPSNYQTYENADFGTVKGVELELDVRRTNNVQLNANYTLSFAQGTGADAASTAQIVWRQETAPFYPRFLSPLDFDQRHKFNVTVDYRLGEDEGPEIGGAHLLENFGLNVVATVATGLPYTRRDDESPLFTAFNGFLEGQINGERLPSTSLVNLRVDRRFNLGGANLTAFLWVQNLLDSDNVQFAWWQTGLANDDGYLSSELGVDDVRRTRNSQGEGIANSFVDHYKFAANSPFHYGIPRMTRLGVRLDF